MTAWDLNRAALRDHLKNDKLKDFLRWSTIEATMFVGDVGFIHREFEYISSCSDWVEGIITETKIGNPKLLWNFTSGNLIHQYYHLKQWLDRSPQTVDQLTRIVEVGAGYGAMALICRRLGFKGSYYIEDLPELKTLQDYYLDNTVGLNNIIWLLPRRCDLFIACHSLSEMPVDERERILSQVQADAYLFASFYEFEGVDNQTWFRKFADSKLGYEWAQWAHPYQENCFYQVGVKI